MTVKTCQEYIKYIAYYLNQLLLEELSCNLTFLYRCYIWYK